jgi:hypothetical protein
LMNKDESQQGKVCTKGYDVNGLTINRVIKQSLLSKFFPIGNNIWGVPKVRFLLSLWVEHRFGEKIAYYTTKYEKQTQQLQLLRFRVSRKIKTILGKSA